MFLGTSQIPRKATQTWALVPLSWPSPGRKCKKIPLTQEKPAFGGSEIWNSQSQQQCRGRQGRPCRAAGKQEQGKGSWAPSVCPYKHHTQTGFPGLWFPKETLRNPEANNNSATFPSSQYFEENGRDDQEAEPVLEGCLRIPMAQTSPEDSNHLKTPETANLSLVVWGEQSLSPSINTLQALLAKISPWAGYFWHSALSRAADRHCRWLSAV